MANTDSVLIRGVGSHNGGAELLLKVCREWAGYRDSRCVADMRRLDKGLRQRWDIGRFLSVPKLGPFESCGINVLPRILADRLDLVGSRHVSAVLDASGFSLGDQWTMGPMKVGARRYEYWARRGTPVVFLPQAFGPFDDKNVAQVARRTLADARLIVARDSESLHHLKQLLPGDERLRLAPDITIGLLTGLDHVQGDTIAIVPNVNIVEKANRADPLGDYAKCLTEVAREISRRGLDPFLLVHSKHGDPRVVSAVKQLSPDLVVQTPRDGLAAKQLIAECRAVVAGRFHAVVSALSQGVPAVTHSWSHKYLELLKDFGCPHLLTDPFDPEATIATLDSALLDKNVAVTLQAAGSTMRKSLDELWVEVSTVLSQQT